MNNDLSTFDHLQKLAKLSRRYTDSLVLELTDAFMETIGGLQTQLESCCLEEEWHMRDNILDNCDFKINQRRVSGKISTPGYFLDRWKLVTGDVTIEDDGITLNGTIEQKLENTINDAVTASAFFDNGVMAASYDKSTSTFTIKADGQRLKMAKLEIGNKQTLARQENGIWVLNDPPPNPAQELVKCQRYQVVLEGVDRSYAVAGTFTVYTDNQLGFSFPLSSPLRISTPTIRSTSSISIVRINKKAVSNIPLTATNITDVRLSRTMLSGLLHTTAEKNPELNPENLLSTSVGDFGIIQINPNSKIIIDNNL